jgi:hypothetical protein
MKGTIAVGIQDEKRQPAPPQERLDASLGKPRLLQKIVAVPLHPQGVVARRVQLVVLAAGQKLFEGGDPIRVFERDDGNVHPLEGLTPPGRSGEFPGKPQGRTGAGNLVGMVPGVHEQGRLEQPDTSERYKPSAAR